MCLWRPAFTSSLLQVFDGEPAGHKGNVCNDFGNPYSPLADQIMDVMTTLHDVVAFHLTPVVQQKAHAWTIEHRQLCSRMRSLAELWIQCTFWKIFFFLIFIFTYIDGTVWRNYHVNYFFLSIKFFRYFPLVWVGVGGFSKVVATFSHVGRSFNISWPPLGMSE